MLVIFCQFVIKFFGPLKLSEFTSRKWHFWLNKRWTNTFFLFFAALHNKQPANSKKKIVKHSWNMCMVIYRNRLRSNFLSIKQLNCGHGKVKLYYVYAVYCTMEAAHRMKYNFLQIDLYCLQFQFWNNEKKINKRIALGYTEQNLERAFNKQITFCWTDRKQLRFSFFSLWFFLFPSVAC